MRTDVKAVLCLLLLPCSLAQSEEFHSRYWAQDTLSLEEDIETPDDLLDTPDSSASDFSKRRSTRQGHWQITMVPLAFDVYPVPSYGAHLSYFWSEQSGIEFLYGFGNADIFERQVKIEKTALRGFYLLPSQFHASSGVGMRNVRSVPLPTKDDGGQSSVSKITADFALGKSWLTETFLFAIDFWGVTIPLRQIHIRGEDLRETKDLNAEAKSFSIMQHRTTYQVLRFRFGMEF